MDKSVYMSNATNEDYLEILGILCKINEKYNRYTHSNEASNIIDSYARIKRNNTNLKEKGKTNSTYREISYSAAAILIATYNNVSIKSKDERLSFAIDVSLDKYFKDLNKEINSEKLYNYFFKQLKIKNCFEEKLKEEYLVGYYLDFDFFTNTLEKRLKITKSSKKLKKTT